MSKYGMSLKSGLELIAQTQASNLQSAYTYFSKLKQMDIVSFKKIFIVIEL